MIEQARNGTILKDYIDREKLRFELIKGLSGVDNKTLFMVLDVLDRQKPIRLKDGDNQC